MVRTGGQASKDSGPRQARDKVLTGLSRLGPVSRSELSRRTRLAPSTVSAIVSELMDEGLVVELSDTAEHRRGGAGRPPTLIGLHRRAGVVLGLDFGKKHVKVAVADLAHHLLAERQAPLEADAPAQVGIARAVDLVTDVLAASATSREDILCVGMGIPGPVQDATGELGDSTILPGWVGVRAHAAMSTALGLDVVVDNDANLGALAEWAIGAARGCSEVIYLKLATGIGAGLIINGRPFHGIGGTAGEIGHLMIDPAGPVCRCGNRGCLEVVAGADAILDSLRRTHGDLTVAELLQASARGDLGTRRALADAGRIIGTALGTVCNLLNPQRVVVGGELGSAGEVIIEPSRQALDGSAIRSAAQDVDVVEAHLGDRAELLGAVALAVRSADPQRIGQAN